METTPKYKPGTMFKTQGKHPRTCTVVDILITRNMAGDVVAVRYVASLEFCGQTVLDRNVVAATIARGLITKQEV
jgi:hypothetical protein